MPLTLETWFARPALLAALAVVPLLTLLAALAWWRRRRALAALGNGPGVRRQVLVRPALRRWRGVCLSAGLALVALAAAGPQWGREHGTARAAAADLVVGLDLSRSMAAEQPSRLERAGRLLRDLADHLERSGGRRVAMVVFAARPRLLFPLTRDYDYFRACVKQAEDGDLPPLLPEPDAPFVSGTRFGAALARAVQAHDPARAGRQAILLVSDGDDPAADDGEWRQGVEAARARGIRVYAVGVGDPDHDHPIPDNGDVLRHDGQVVRTRLDEALLEEIARRTGGAYLPAHNHALPLGTLIDNLLDRPPDDAATDGAAAEGPGLSAYRPRYAWFLAPGLGLLLLSLLLNEGPAPSRRRTRPAPAVLAGLTVLLAGTLAPPDADPLIRAGNEAFAAGDFEKALRDYDLAEPGATDPGLIAFNRAAACFRLGRFADAALAYRQCLDDDCAPPGRRARARYDLGTALVRQSGGTSAALLTEAVASLRACLAEPALEPEVRASARHNLELAQLLLLRARAAAPDKSPPEGGDDHRPDEKPGKPGPSGADAQNPDNGKKGPTQERPQSGDEGKGAPGEGKKDRVKAGALQVLPDTDRVAPLPPEQADAALDEIIAGIIRERRAYWQQSARPPGGARNW